MLMTLMYFDVTSMIHLVIKFCLKGAFVYLVYSQFIDRRVLSVSYLLKRAAKF